MRVLYLINSLAGGGAEAVVTNLVNHLSQHTTEVAVDVATLYITPERHLAGKQFPIHCLALESKYSVKGIRRLAALLSERSYDVVHVHLFPANYYAALASLHVPQVAWIFTEHSVWNRRRRFLPLRLTDTAVYARYAHIIAVSEQVAAALRRWLPLHSERISVIPNGIPIPQVHASCHHPESAGESLVLFVGRLEHVKGIDVLLEAFEMLPPSCTLLVAGEGSQRMQLERLAVELQIQNRVQFLGFCSDVQSLMFSADCVVMPSRWEGLPMVALETMAMGVPIVASAVGGLPEIIEDGVTGWLVPPENPEALALSLRYVLTNRAMAQMAGANARHLIMESYSIKAMSEKTLALYARVLSQRRQGR